ncbi:MAG TPA: hypothetical protein VFC07_00385 [Verrucomicrobiae bacterium]|nr:hypothetical protein [Verrucomicrobiae bacterium]
MNAALLLAGQRLDGGSAKLREWVGPALGRTFSPWRVGDWLPGALPAGWYEVAPLALPPSQRDCYGATSPIS